jgi:hypothetical protein
VYSDGEPYDATITIADGVLHTTEVKVLLPVSETEIRIVGGIFDAEIMTRDPQSGEIVWQNVIYDRL